MTDIKRDPAAGRTAGLLRYLAAGILAGLASAVLNNIIYLFVINLGGHDWVPVVAISILAASFLPNLAAAVAYFILAMITQRARALLTIGITAFVLISILPHLGIGPAPSPALAALPEGFDLVTVPLHIVFGVTAVTLMPWYVNRD